MFQTLPTRLDTFPGMELHGQEELTSLVKHIFFSQLSVSPCIIFFSPPVALYFSKLLNYMKKNNVAKVVPKFDPNAGVNLKPFDGGLTSGYWVRSAKVLPKQGDQYPWSGGINYFQDVKTLYFKSFDTTALDLTYHSK